MRRTAAGRFELPVSAAEAIGFFTPEGERPWAPGWDPQYPAGAVDESSGTIFTTAHGDGETIWVIVEIDRESYAATYSRVTPGLHAGTVRVRCYEQPSSNCIVSVEYDMTALDPNHPGALDAYDGESFASMIADWKRLVTAAV